MANNTIFFPALFCRINARVDIAFKCNNKCANLKKTRIFEQSRSFMEGKWRERQENGEIVWKITQMWRVSWRITEGKWRFVVFSYFVSRCHGGIWPTLSKCFAFALYQPCRELLKIKTVLGTAHTTRLELVSNSSANALVRLAHTSRLQLVLLILPGVENRSKRVGIASCALCLTILEWHELMNCYANFRTKYSNEKKHHNHVLIVHVSANPVTTFDLFSTYWYLLKRKTSTNLEFGNTFDRKEHAN